MTEIVGRSPVRQIVARLLSRVAAEVDQRQLCRRSIQGSASPHGRTWWRLLRIANGLRRMAPIGLTICLAGCAGSILDPSPYDPQNDPGVQNSTAPHSTALGLLTYGSAADAAPKLLALSQGYANERNDMMRQEMLFDIPMVGLGVAAIVNPLFNGAKNTTLGLSLGAAAVGGARLYFGPPTKVTAYNAATQDLLCAWSATTQIAAMESTAAAGDALVATMNNDIGLAQPLASANATLTTARDEAVKSVAALQTALQNLKAAPGTLQDYAVGVITATDNKITGSAQNVSSWVAAVQSATTGGTVKPALAAAPPPGPVLPPGAAPAGPTAAQLTTSLQNESTQADSMTAAITAALGKLTKCPTS
jgi:hypothetical protein